MPQKKIMIKTTFYCYGRSGGESVILVGVPAFPAAVPSSSEENEEAEELAHDVVGDPEVALNDLSFPHGLTHKPARSECVVCVNAKSRHV